MAGTESFVGDLGAGTTEPLGEDGGEQCKGTAVEVLFAKETRETGPSGWEGDGIGQPLPSEALSACGAHLHVVGCRAPPGRDIQKCLQAGVARAEDPCTAGRWFKVRLCSLSGPWPWGRLFDSQD